MICNNKDCEKEFVSKTYNQKFCCEKCRSLTNVKTWIERNKHPCESCGVPVRPESTICHKCLNLNNSKSIEDTKKLTLEEYQNSPSVKDKHPSWKNSFIRNFARAWNKDLKNGGCQKSGCKYNLHVEICHIKPINEFSPNATIGEINDKSNLIALCRNCHWELDHNYWSIENN